MIFWGIDCGSTEIKVVACDRTGAVLHRHKRRTLFPLDRHVSDALVGDGSFESPLAGDGLRPGHDVTATGYGRGQIGVARERITEIRAHYLGAQHQIERGGNDLSDFSIVDIGGQDSKVIVVKGRSIDRFVINRKCAAGTGAYIEELAHRLRIPLEQLPELEKGSDKDLTMNSFCTVFAGQEVIRVLMNGEKLENLVHALYRSVVRRVLEMTAIDTKSIVLTGGVAAHHEPVVRGFREALPGRDIALAPDPQFCGAIGAAIHGTQSKEVEDENHGRTTG